MKILLVGVPKKISSGVRTHVNSLSNGLLTHGHEVVLVDSIPSGIRGKFIALINKLLSFFDKNIAFRWILWVRRVYVEKELSKYKNEEILINIQSVDWYQGILKFINTRNIKIVLTVHGAYSEQLKAKGYSNEIIKMVKEIEISAYNTIPEVIVVSPFLESYVKNISNCVNITMIPNGVILSATAAPKILANKNLKCVFVGSLLHYKGVHIAIDSISELINDGVETTLDIIGDGPERNSLELQVSTNKKDKEIRFRGLMTHNQVMQSLNQYDILLLPSIPYGDFGEEAFPYSCLEAMSMGLPVLASNIGGLPFMIQNDYNGFLVPPNKPHCISKVLKENFDLITGSDYLGLNARRTIEDKFSSGSMASKYIKVYEK